MRRPLIASLLTLILVPFLSGCATQAQREYSAIRENNQSAGAQLITCAAAVYNSPEAAILRPHRPLKLTGATLQQMADTSQAADPEIQAILVTYPRLQGAGRQRLIRS